MQPSVRYCTTEDGVSIAYAVSGAGPPLLFVRGWISHLELMWRAPNFRPFFEALGEHFSVIRFDARGNGLSERAIEDPTFEGLILDVEAVAAAVDLKSSVVLASAFGGPIAASFVSRHPEAAESLILDGTFARGADLTTSSDGGQTLIDLIEHYPKVGARVMSHLTYPDADPAVDERIQRGWEAIEPDMLRKLYGIAYQFDVDEELKGIRLPTLVVHRDRAQAIPYRAGQRLAAMLPQAEFVSIPGSAANLWEGNPEEVLKALSRFLKREFTLPGRPGDPARPAATFQAILFTDLEASTSITQRIGDEAAQELLRAHNIAVREAVTQHGGRDVKHTGDGIMAGFPAANAAVSAALQIQRELFGGEVRVRIGVNAGEPIAENDDYFGTAVQLASRITDHAEPGQVLVSNVVRELCAGRTFKFERTVEATLKGFDDPVTLYEVRP